MNVARNHFAIAAHSDKYVFAIGGEFNNNLIRSAERFDIANNQWEALPDLREGRMGAAACVHDGSVYVFGGLAHS